MTIVSIVKKGCRKLVLGSDSKKIKVQENSATNGLGENCSKIYAFAANCLILQRIDDTQGFLQFFTIVSD